VSCSRFCIHLRMGTCLLFSAMFRQTSTHFVVAPFAAIRSVSRFLRRFIVQIVKLVIEKLQMTQDINIQKLNYTS
jgi:hypothetical protein